VNQAKNTEKESELIAFRVKKGSVTKDVVDKAMRLGELLEGKNKAEFLEYLCWRYLQENIEAAQHLDAIEKIKKTTPQQKSKNY
jgi:hypothetical protein